MRLHLRVGLVVPSNRGPIQKASILPPTIYDSARFVSTSSRIELSKATIAIILGCIAIAGSVCGEQPSSTQSNLDTASSVSFVEDLGKYPTSFERRTALRRMLSDADEKQILRMLADSVDVASTSQKRSMQMDIFRRLAMINPSLALEQASEFTWAIRREFIGAIFGEWSSRYPDAAAKHASKLGPGRERLVALRSILGSLDDPTTEFASNISRDLGLAAESVDIVEDWLVALASLDPEKSWYQILNDSRSDSEQINVLVSIATVWIDRDGWDVAHKVNDSKLQHDLKGHVVGRVLKNFLQLQPRDTFELAVDLYDGTNAQIFRPLVESWARIDPSAALDALSGLAFINVPQTEISALRDLTVDSWARTYPADLLKNASKISKGLQASERELAVEVLSRRDPEEAANYLESIRNHEKRLWVATGLAQFWAWKDVDRALDWALDAESEFGDDWQGLLVPVLREAARLDPERALQAALEVPLNSSGTGLESRVVEIVARSDVDLAESMLPKMRNTRILRRAADSVAMALALNGETDRALGLAEMFDGPERDSFNSNLLGGWARRQPQGLFAAMDALPSAELTGMAAESLAVINEQRAVLHDDQFEQVKLVLANRIVREPGDDD